MFERKCLEMENGVNSSSEFKGWWFYSKNIKTPAVTQLVPLTQGAIFLVF